MDNIEQKSFVFGGLFTLANRVQILGDQIDPDMTIKQWLFITMIQRCHSDAPTLSELAKVIGSSRQNLKKMALILEKRGFVELKKDETDARALRVTLTKKCEEYFISKNRLGIQFMEKLFNKFDDELIGGLYNGFQKLLDNIIEMENTNEEKK